MKRKHRFETVPLADVADKLLYEAEVRAAAKVATKEEPYAFRSEDELSKRRLVRNARPRR